MFTSSRSRPFRRWHYFGCWLSMANGLVQTAQNIDPKQVLKLPVLPPESMRISMPIGQISVSAWAGPFAARNGNRRTLILSQLRLGSAPRFFLLATPPQPW